jgi:hypothetical protein
MGFRGGDLRQVLGGPFRLDGLPAVAMAAPGPTVSCLLDRGERCTAVDVVVGFADLDQVSFMAGGWENVQAMIREILVNHIAKLEKLAKVEARFCPLRVRFHFVHSFPDGCVYAAAGFNLAQPNASM